jgi:hypothetical protein
MRSSGWTLLGLALVVAAPSQAQEMRVVADEGWCRQDTGGWRAKPRHCEVREATLPAGGTLAVDARPNGGIEVRGWDRSEVRLRVMVVANAPTEADARALAERVQVETSGTVRATGPQGGGGSGWWASYRLDVPREQALKLRADNGGLHLSRLAGDVEVSTVNGGLNLDDVGGRIHGRTVNGGIHVELGGSEWAGDGLDLATTNGGVHLELPADYTARLEASTVNGGVSSDVPLESRSRHSGGKVALELGRGGALLHLETTNGGLHIAKR